MDLGGGIVQLWTDSGIQIMVLLSFTFQVFLFFFAGFRRRGASALLNLLLWLVYLLADSTAIYALGHMSYSGPSGKHQLVAFWAPLLLVHLGGPDSITAYAIEDSRLWLRHLLMLVVQTLGASYVLLKYIATASGTGRLLRSASVLMFTVGVLKYGERTWALRCGTTGGIKSRRKLYRHRYFNPSTMIETLEISLLNQKDDNEEELLTLAHFLLITCLDLFVGGYAWASRSTPYLYPLRRDDMYKLTQMHLSLMYDIMYTKAWVIHTWYGYCIRVISLVATIVSLFLFTFSHKNGYNRGDVDITYCLLVGAVVLEIISVIKIIGSTWMSASLFSFKRTNMLVNVLKLVRRRVRATSMRRCSNSIGQHNMFHVCTRDKSELGYKVTKKTGLDRWWTKVHLVCTADISKTALPKLMLETLHKLDPENSRGIQVLQSSGLGKEQAGWSHWSLNLDFVQSILIWHLATDVYLLRSKEVGRQRNIGKAVQMLSNYMMFLLVTKPDMLPGYVEETWYWQTHSFLEIKWRRRGNVEPRKNWWGVLKKQFHNDGPNGSTIPQNQQLVSICQSKYLNEREGKWQYFPPEDRMAGSTSYIEASLHASEQAAELLHLDSSKPDLLEVIFRVWLEMLFYASQRCGPESHASQLSRGGEFITVIWILSGHFNFPPRYFDS